MGKHKNSRQDKILLDFMEENRDLARGFSKKEKYLVDSLWSDLAKNLNSQGPPSKDVSGWKKVWNDWKCNIRKKISHNKNEKKATGGGPENILPISSIEDAIAKLTGIYSVVDGIQGSTSFGCETVDVETPTIETLSGQIDNDEEMVIDEANDNEVSTHLTSQYRKKRAPCMPENNIEKYMNSQKLTLNEISEQIKELVQIEKENMNSLKKIYRGVDKLADVLKETNREKKSHHSAMEKLILEKNQLKVKILEIKKQKLDVLSKKLD